MVTAFVFFIRRILKEGVRDGAELSDGIPKSLQYRWLCTYNACDKPSHVTPSIRVTLVSPSPLPQIPWPYVLFGDLSPMLG
jgi:hypothetical protein